MIKKKKRNEKLLIDRPTYLYNMKTNFNAFIIPSKKTRLMDHNFSQSIYFSLILILF